jgi:GNAT superfamily N-acetyltransferase
MANFRLELREPTDDETHFLEESINQFNIAFTGIPFGGKVAVLAYNTDDHLIGGATGFKWGDSFKVDFLYLEQNWRGQDIGTQIMDRIEQEAAARKCTQLYLDTYSFQAIEFYKKRGFEVIGTLENFPTPHTFYFLKKTLQK